MARSILPRRMAALVACVVVAIVAVGCAADNGEASFDPSTSCGGAAQQKMPGAYPDLEARVPAQFQGVAATQRDSGRFCAQESLGALWNAGIREEQFGGAWWPLGDKAGGVQLAVFRAPGLTVQGVADQYKTGAQANQQITIVSAAALTVNGRSGYRLDVLAGESRQAVVVWPSADGSVVQVVVAADVAETVVQAGIAALG